MGETGFHVRAILDLYQALRHLFEQVEQVYVAADMFLYYEEGNPNANKVPDVFVVKGVSKRERRIYKLWEEEVAPCTIFEITSKSTRLEDLATKRGLYELLGVREYFLFDPLDEYLSPRLQGFQLAQDYYQPMTPVADGSLISHELGVILKPEGLLLRIIDSTTNKPIPNLDEAVEQVQAAIKFAQAEAQRADAAEAELARLGTELEQLRRQLGKD
jgi:Uma2 family endonuclease